MGMNRYRSMAVFREELRHFLRRSETASRAVGITPRQHLLLLQIAGSEDGTATVSDLVQKLALTQSAVTELVQRAEQAQLVTRRQSTEDGRVVHLSLTDTGSLRLEEVTEALDAERAHLQEMLDGLEL